MTRVAGENPSPDLSGESGLGRVWTIELPYRRPLLNLNEINGKHWAKFTADKRNLNKAGFYLARYHRLPRPILSAVTAELIYWPGNNTVHDADNMAPTLKALLDGIRQAGALQDDRGRNVRSAICTVIERDDDPRHRTDARMALVIRQV